MTAATLRDATEQDAPALLTIYAPYVLRTAITFECDVPAPAEFAARIHGVLEKGFPYLVAQRGGDALGYAYAEPFHERAAFFPSAQLSIYLADGARHQGLGRTLYAALEERMIRRGIQNAYSLIAATSRDDDPYLTDASLRFHERMGFATAGRLHGCAVKFGLWYDLVYMEKRIAP